jgi:nucleoside-diphosphate-sugar epimerase
MKKIVITSATGMIGSALVRCALEQNMEVLCIVRESSGRLDNLPSSEKTKILFADLSDYADIDVSERYDAFFHLAWDKTFGVSRDDADIQVQNIQYTLDAVRLAKRLGCSVFIGAGSQAEYGIVSEPLKPDTPVNPRSGYGIAKYSAGKLSKLLCGQLGIRHNWIRILSVFGSFDAPHTLIMYAINELRAGRSPEFTKCEQVWDYLYSDDAARALLAVGAKGIDGKVYPLGSGRRRKLSDYLEALRGIINPEASLLFGKKEYYPYQPMFLCADIAELTTDTGWTPEISFEEGIKLMLNNPDNEKLSA